MHVYNVKQTHGIQLVLKKMYTVPLKIWKSQKVTVKEVCHVNLWTFYSLGPLGCDCIIVLKDIYDCAESTWLYSMTGTFNKHNKIIDCYVSTVCVLILQFFSAGDKHSTTWSTYDMRYFTKKMAFMYWSPFFYGRHYMKILWWM